jgi:hypothetical protein
MKFAFLVGEVFVESEFEGADKHLALVCVGGSRCLRQLCTVLCGRQQAIVGGRSKNLSSLNKRSMWCISLAAQFFSETSVPQIILDQSESCSGDLSSYMVRSHVSLGWCFF